MEMRVARFGLVGCLVGLLTAATVARQEPEIALKVVKLNPRCVVGANALELCANDCDCDLVTCEGQTCVGGTRAGLSCVVAGECLCLPGDPPECVDGTCGAGTCVGGPGDGDSCALFTDCAENCVSRNVCVGDSVTVETPCTVNSDCPAGAVCKNDPKCIGGADEGELCVRDATCLSLNCSGGSPFVIPPGEVGLSTVSASPGDRLLCEYYASDWSPTGTDPELLQSWQLSVKGVDLRSGTRGELEMAQGGRCCRVRRVLPAILPQRLDQDCQDIAGCCGDTCGTIKVCDVDFPVKPCSDNSDCDSNLCVDDNEGICTEGSYPPELLAFAKGAYIARDRSDFVFAAATGDIIAMDLGAADAGDVRFSDALAIGQDTPVRFFTGAPPAYFGSLVLDASNDACGQFIVRPAPDVSDGLFEPDDARIPTTNVPLTVNLGSCDCQSMTLLGPAQNCSIDAREPGFFVGGDFDSWDSFTLDFDCLDTRVLTEAHFDLFEVPSIGPVPTIFRLDASASELTMTLNEPLEPGKWTCVRFRLGQSDVVCLGAQPADPSGDSLSEAADVTAIIDCIENPGSCELFQCDSDHSGICAPADVLMLIDLLDESLLHPTSWLDEFIGNGTVDEREFCPLSPTGACCDDIGCVRESATQLECQVFGGDTWHQGQTCADVCP